MLEQKFTPKPEPRLGEIMELLSVIEDRVVQLEQRAERTEKLLGDLRESVGEPTGLDVRHLNSWFFTSSS